MDAAGAAGRYIFTGLLEGKERIEALAAADVFVLPSYSEGAPIAPLEALAAKVPVILTAACNLSRIEERRAGIITAPDVGALSEAMSRLADDPLLRRQMGLNGRELVLETYTWDKIAAQMFTVYQDILRSHRRTSSNGSGLKNS